MSSSRMDYWLQTGTSLAVLIGVLLVGWELRQTNMIAAIERVNDNVQMWESLYEFEYENDVLLLVKKATESPEELTDNELLKLEIYLNRVMNILFINEISNEAHGFLGPSAEAALYAEYYFGYEFSRAWLRDGADWYMLDAPKLIQALLHEIDSTPPTNEFTLLNQLKAFR